MRPKPAARARAKSSPRVEPLDPRVLFSVNVTVNAAQQFQTMTGFGTSLYTGSTTLPYGTPGSATYQNFVNDYANDLGANVLRINLQADVLPNKPATPLGTDLAANIAALNLDSNNAAVQGKLASAINAAEGGKLQVMATVWSPPAWMKTNNSLFATDLNNTTYIDPLNHLKFQNDDPSANTDPSNMLDADNLEQFARYCAAYVAGMDQKYGINITALSIQNEPIFNATTFDSCTYYQDQSTDPTDVQYRRYAQAVQAVGGELYKDGLATTIVGPENVGPDAPVTGTPLPPTMTVRQEALIGAVMQDATVDQFGRTAKDYLGAIAIHGWPGDHYTPASGRQWWAPYEQFIQAQPVQRPDWQTESDYGGRTWVGTNVANDPNGLYNPLTGALGMAMQMHDTLVTGNASVFLNWQAADGHLYTTNTTLMDSTAATVADPERSDAPQWNYDAFKHWSAFVAAGSVRVGTSYVDDTGTPVPEDPSTVNTDAYVDPAGHTLTVELTNENPAPETVNISLANLSVAEFDQDWLTDSTNTWADLGPVTVANGVATLTVPGYSVVTLRGATQASTATVGSVAGTVYADANADGLRSPGEAGVTGLTVFLDQNNNGVLDPGEPQTVTAADGTYSFPAVPPGSYTARVVAPAWRQTAPAANAGRPVTVLAGAATTAVDFGLTQAPPVAVAGGPYTVPEGGAVALNGTGSSEAAGSVTLYQWDTDYNGTTFNPVVTGAAPTFSAAGLDGPSTRTVALRVTGADGLVSPIATATVSITDVPPTATFTATAASLGQPATVAFTNPVDPSPADVAAGFTYSYDFNDDGTFDLLNVAAATATVPAADLTTTGPHTVRGEIRDKDGGTTDYTATVQVNAPASGSIAGTVLANGAGLAGVVVYLDADKDGSDDHGEPAVTTTAAGTYSFPNLAPGTYRIRQVLPTGDTLASPATGYYDVTVAAGQAVVGQDFTDVLPTPTPTRLVGTTSGTAGANGLNPTATVAKATDGDPTTFFDAPAANGDYVQIDLGAAETVGQIGYAPRAGFASRMVGGLFQASNSATFVSGVITVGTVTAAPAQGVLTTVTPATATAYRYWRYVAPSGSYGNVAEFELFGPGGTTPTPTPTPTRLTGTTFGTAGANALNPTFTVAKATDGDLATFFDAQSANGDYVAVDLGSAKVVSQIKYAPRAGLASRMVGGYVQASNSATFAAGNVTVYAVTVAPAQGVLTTVTPATTAAYRYWRYVAPNGSYGNIAEFQLFGPAAATPTPTRLTGTTTGTAGANNLNPTMTVAAATDGNATTFFDSASANGNYVQIDLGTARAVTQIAYAPRSGFANRMVGGLFQASNAADFSSGVVTAYTVTAAPAQDVLTTVTPATTAAYRYWRYVAPANSYGNIAEFELFG